MPRTKYLRSPEDTNYVFVGGRSSCVVEAVFVSDGNRRDDRPIARLTPSSGLRRGH